ncbi:MAG: lysyl-tRNA synthetase, lysyl-tRNA synthetase, class II [candidate division WS6 bacterium GW2011_GWF1_33_233]|nr:MAG: lysyl-tRNA synthetase, lysyl-tRNA synthetase, class II [candidate division WS6 bacterium GW2011_GWF1_33_233]
MEELQKSNLVGQRELRIEKVKKLKELGIEAYPAKSYREYSIGHIVENFDNFENKTTCLAGRLMAWRTHGKLIFGDIKDQTGKIQLMIKQDSY